MVHALDRLEIGHVKNWYRKHTDAARLDAIVSQAEGRGYKWDAKSGLLLRPVYTDVELPHFNQRDPDSFFPYSSFVSSGLGYTVIDVVFPRPVDFHYHIDVGEAFKIVKGAGEFVLGTFRTSILPDKQIFVPKGRHHTFRPDKNESVEARIACTGLLDQKKEVCVKRFDNVPKWVEYFGG